MPGTWGGGDLVCVQGTGSCGEDESLWTARGRVSGISIAIAGRRSLYSFVIWSRVSAKLGNMGLPPGLERKTKS